MKKRREIENKKARSAVLVVAAGGFALFALASLIMLPLNVSKHQKSEQDAADQEVLQLKSDIEILDHEIHLLETDQGLERKARKDLGLVFPGEESYRIIF